jgi:hypothetical protein
LEELLSDQQRPTVTTDEVGIPDDTKLVQTSNSQRKEQNMIDKPEMSSNMIGQIAEGIPVYEANGERVGHVSKHIMEGNNLILHTGLIFPKDLSIPLSAVRSSDSTGMHLAITKDDLKHERYAASLVTEEPASAVETGQGPDPIVRGRSVMQQHPHTFMRGVTNIEQHPHTFTRGVTDVEQHPHTFTRGVTNIEYPEEAR